MASITLGGGCFWCTEAAFERLDGVEQVVPGYAGGQTEDPAYEEVCSGTTGHAEVVKVIFDPDVLPLRSLLHVFFGIHDPTTKDREGHDVGSQYRSIVLHHDDEQRALVDEVIQELDETLFEEPIVTEIAPLEAFYEAEDEHQDYYAKNPDQPYCKLVIDPKLKKLAAQYSDKVKAES